MTKKINLKIVDLFYGYKCNLACVGCNPGSDIIQHTDYDPSLDSILKSITDLSHRVETIENHISLLGGEPFLYWEERIIPIIRHIRQLFPTTTICLVTNGFYLHKFQQQLIDLLLEINYIDVSITDHTRGFADDPVAVKYHTNLTNFLSHPIFFKIHDCHYGISDYKVNIHITPEPLIFKAQYKTVNNKRYPFATNDPMGSYKTGCTGNICNHLVDSKLYKCSKLAYIRDTLKETNQLDDPEWSKYLAYQPIDLTDTNNQPLLDEFETNLTSPIAECDMCPNRPVIGITAILQTKDNVLKKQVR